MSIDFTFKASSTSVGKKFDVLTYIQVTKSFWEPLGISKNESLKNIIIEEFLSGSESERTDDEKELLISIKNKIKKSSLAHIASQSCSEMILLLCKYLEGSKTN